MDLLRSGMIHAHLSIMGGDGLYSLTGGIGMRRILFFGSLFFLLSGTYVWAQSNVEDPPANSTQSGISLVRGWVCTATKIEVVIDNQSALQIPYGSPRGDTQSVCGGKINTGFGAVINWNDLGDGSHVVNILADGQQIASIPVTVVTFGVSFLRGASKTLTTGFGGCRAALVWRESLQNFAVAETDLCFQPLLGQWEFRLKRPGGDELDHYALERIEVRGLADTDEEVEGVVGTDLDHGGEVEMLRTSDLGVSSPYDFALASVVHRCEVFLFNQIGANTVQGIGLSFPADPFSGCEDIPSPLPTTYEMTGTRTGAALSAEEAREFAAQTQPPKQASGASITRDVLAEILKKTSQLLPR